MPHHTRIETKRRLARAAARGTVVVTGTIFAWPLWLTLAYAVSRICA